MKRWIAASSLAAGALVLAFALAGAEIYELLPGAGVLRTKSGDRPISLAPQPDVFGHTPKVPDLGYTDEHQGVDVVIEAPWRVQLRSEADLPNYVPLLVFIPDARFPPVAAGRDAWEGEPVPGVTAARPLRPLHLQLRELAVNTGGRAVYLERDQAVAAAPSTVEVVDEMGIIQSRVFGRGVVNPANEGWHRILRIPVGALVVTRPAEPVSAALDVAFTYDRIYDTGTAGAIVHRKSLRIVLSPLPLPSPGRGWLALDAHNHSVAEYSTKSYATAPRKAFGGPIQMFKEAAYALGLTDVVPGAQRPATDHPIITTDHNTFFDDDDIIKVGPSSDQATAGASYPVPAHFAGGHPNGRAEFERMRGVLGDGAGEEITLSGSKLGHHLLAYRTRHFSGAWHGGCLALDDFFSILKTLFYVVAKSGACGASKHLRDANVNTLEAVLAAMAATPAFPRGFAYASHPADALIPWRDPEMLTVALFDRGTRFVRDGRDFVFKGLQLWNGRSTWLIKGALNFRDDIDFYNLQPFVASAGKAAWTRISLERDPSGALKNPRAELDRTGEMWHRAIREGLRFSFAGHDDVRLIRKVYAIAGTDAHGDFNYETAIPGTILHEKLRTDWGWTVSNNAFGVVRTYVDASRHGETDSRSTTDRALDALAHGQAVLSDGPVIVFDLDSDRRFDSATHTWYDDGVGASRNADGEIGGGPGAAGRKVGGFDGGRTMLMRRGSGDVMIRYRWETTPEFGGMAASLLVARDSVSAPATVRRSIAVGAAGTEHEAPLADAGPPITEITAVAMELVGGPVQNPRLGADDAHRAFTNPVWIVPVDIACAVDPARASVTAIDREALTVTFSFAISMSGRPEEARLDPLGPDRMSRPHSGTRLVPSPSGGRVGGWRSRGTPVIRNGDYAVTNASPVPRASSGESRFVAYLRGPSDFYGNELNSVAAPVTITESLACVIR